MSDIRFRCPECKGKLIISKSKALTKVPCPLCGETITAWGAQLLDLRFDCPECHRKLVIDLEAAGTDVVCPRCDRDIVVPKPVAEIPPPPVVESEPQDIAPLPAPSDAPPKPTDGGKLSKEEMDFLTSSTPQSTPAARPAHH